MLIEQFKKIDSWSFLSPELEPILASIDSKLSEVQSENVFPLEEDIFKAFTKTSFDDVSLVILGQDPYHQKKSNGNELVPQAMGLSFSVPKGVQVPPSLKNIYKVIKASNPKFEIPDHGDLTPWTEQGVLLLNTALTVEEGKAGSHSKFGWSKFTEVVINALAQREKPIVFLSWGRHAHKVTNALESTHHVVIKTSHPSPLGATKESDQFVAFMRSNCFSEANLALKNHGLSSIDFSI
ncbi:uracil-DNA glycosylase [Vibrio harveyi]|uniref:uracil-DNA glycosylase n=1 Tax=Vibrio harveyi TaxID=669 RepID=UPI003CE6E49D